MLVRTSFSLPLLVAGALLAAAPAAYAASAPKAKPLSVADLPELGEQSPEESAPLFVARLGLDSPVAALCADPRAKAVLDSDLPGLTTRPEYIFFKHMSLNKLKVMSRGKLTDADLARVDAELQRISLDEAGDR